MDADVQLELLRNWQEWRPRGRLKKRFSHADTKQFALGYENGGGVQPVFVHRPEETPVFGGDGRVRKGVYYSERMFAALGLEPGLPLELQLNPAPRLRVPPRTFDEDPPFPKQMLVTHTIYLAPGSEAASSFEAKFRDVITDVKITHTTSAESRKWSRDPIWATRFSS